MQVDSDVSKYSKLKAIYDLFDQAVDTKDMACKKGCAACCTCNVTLTSLEGQYILQHLESREQENLQNRIKNNFPKKRYLPAITFNTFARLCVEGKEIPEEENDPNWGACPLLVDNVCTIYDVRPFACRALLSSINCKDKGHAQVSEFLLTLNNLFLQYIEQLDLDGYFGNLSDMITHLMSEQSYSGSKQHICTNNNPFVFNEPVKVLMVPPEHREEARPMIEKLSRILNS